jgi:hypothetical protein
MQRLNLKSPSVLEEARDLYESIRKGNLSAPITPENINVPMMSTPPSTPLFIAISINNAPLVMSLLDNPALDLGVNKQGEAALYWLLNKAYVQPQEKSFLQAVKQVLGNDIFHHPHSDERFSLLNPNLGRLVKSLHNIDLWDLFKILRNYQVTMMGYSIIDPVNKIYLEYATMLSFQNWNVTAAKAEWRNRVLKSIVEMIQNDAQWIEKCQNTDDFSIKLLQMAVNSYFSQQKQNLPAIISAEIAYAAAMKLGLLYLENPGYEPFGKFQKFFPMAKQIVSLANLQIRDGELKFLIAYHSIPQSIEPLASHNRLAKHLDYQLLLHPALQAGVRAAKLILPEKNFVQKLLDIVLLNPAATSNIETFTPENILFMTGLKLFYGIELQQDYPMACAQFEKIAAVHHRQEPVIAFYGYLMSAMAQLEMLKFTPARSRSKAIQRAMLTVLDMFFNYSKSIDLSADIEVFNLLQDYLHLCVDKTDRLIVADVMLRYYAIMSMFTDFEPGRELMKRTMHSLFDTTHMRDKKYLGKILYTLKACMKGSANLKEWKFHQQRLEAVRLATTDGRFADDNSPEALEQKRMVSKCLTEVYSSVPEYTTEEKYFSMAMLEKAIQYFEALQALEISAQHKTHVKNFSWLYKKRGDLQSDVHAQLQDYEKAIAMFDTSAIYAITGSGLSLVHTRALRRGVMNAIGQKIIDKEVLTTIHFALVTLQQSGNPFDAKLCRFSELAYKHGVLDSDIDNQTELFAANFFPAYNKLLYFYLDAGKHRRAFYCAAKILCEIALNNKILRLNYGYSQEQLAAIAAKPLQLLQGIANDDDNRLQKLAGWYLNFITITRRYLPVDNAIYDINTLLLLAVKDNSDMYNEIMLGMQALNLHSYIILKVFNEKRHNPLYKKFNAFMQLELDNNPTLRVKYLNPEDMVVEVAEPVSESNAMIEMSVLTQSNLTLFAVSPAIVTPSAPDIAANNLRRYGGRRTDA